MDSNRGLLGSVLTTQPTLLHLVFILKSSAHRSPPPIVCSQILTLVNCFWCFNFDIDIFYVYSDFLSGLWLLLRYRLILLRYIRISLQFQSFLRWHWCSFMSTLSFLRQPQRFSYLDLDFFLPRFGLFLT